MSFGDGRLRPGGKISKDCYRLMMFENGEEGWGYCFVKRHVGITRFIEMSGEIPWKRRLFALSQVRWSEIATQRSCTSCRPFEG